ncbi:MAG TPA: hypothetical protein VKN99_13610 [Polyangia bacterium]|nr:hypothetical protein [Polyangia bacterium]
MRALAVVVPVLLAAMAGGCVHWHLEHNAPGLIDVHKPPEHIAEPQPEDPEDPGERMLVLSGGGLVGGGWGAGGAAGNRSVASAGGEISLLVGSTPFSHREDNFFVYPLTALGLNLGWTLYDSDGTGLGPLYAELQLQDLPHLTGLAAGWAVDPDDRVHGPQATGSFGPVYVRFNYLFDRGSALTVGLVIKAPLVWVWSR